MVTKCPRCGHFLIVRPTAKVHREICINRSCSYPSRLALGDFAEALKYIWAAWMMEADEAVIEALPTKEKNTFVDALLTVASDKGV